MTTIAPTLASDTYPHYAAAYAEQQAGNSPVIRELRERGWEAFNRIGLPTARRGNEPWKYTNAGPVAREAFSYADFASRGETGPTQAEVKSVAPWQPDWRTLVVVDGAFAPGLSTGTAAGAGIAAGLPDAVESDPELAERVLGSPRQLLAKTGSQRSILLSLATGSAYPYRPEPMPASSTSCT